MTPLDHTSAAGALARLAGHLAALAPYDGSFATCIPGVHAVRAASSSTELVHGLHRPALCIVAQGAKTVMLGGESYDYDPSRMMIFSLDLPIAALIRQASAAAPYLSFRLDFDQARLGELILKVYPDGVPPLRDQRAVHVAQAGEPVIDAAARLMALAAQKEDAALLAPLVIDEILLRLLRGPFGARLAQLGRIESHRIGKVVAWIRANYDQAIRIDDMAALAHMSPSSLHEQFKSLTSMSPLQFQKTLRLQEARRLMLSTGMDASLACQRVGYASASQFSREYTRHFGDAPTRDISRLRNVGLANAVSFAQ
ncbi:AraC family transcriptional regulator [Massilia sp. Leaf139]|uniref:AraC family transcriptional regulator n=1 Tax=Massilia sp. Leaf139 TaxID=1736272 RepID=UPI0006F85589|nr:AraC family transcriptional regulator [Massilia sp. Leaf139]KQQ87301.1 AraC family transcriptional regulator [Massilia sp. Leaf139]